MIVINREIRMKIRKFQEIEDLHTERRINADLIYFGSAPRVWTVGDLGAFYTQHRAELHAHASRVLKDSIKAEEITQDALIKFMLAAP